LLFSLYNGDFFVGQAVQFVDDLVDEVVCPGDALAELLVTGGVSLAAPPFLAGSTALLFKPPTTTRQITSQLSLQSSTKPRQRKQ